MEAEDLPDDAHVVRYVKPRMLLEDGRVDGSEFRLRPNESGLSVHWLECFRDRSKDEQLNEVRRLSRLNVKTTARKVTDSAASGSRGAMESVAEGSRIAMDSATAVSRAAWKSASVSATGLLSVTQGVLASRISADLDSMLAGLAKGSATIYDKAMDAGYLATSLGGGNHRLFDGGHTIAGAFKAVRGASTEDSILQEGLGFLQGMFRDLTTPKGLPLANWDQATYDHVASFLESRFHVSREWFYDLNSYTAAELVGGTIGILAVVFQWNRADTESFSRTVGSMGAAAVLSANPLLLVITVVAFARAFQKVGGRHAAETMGDGDAGGGAGHACGVRMGGRESPGRPERDERPGVPGFSDRGVGGGGSAG